jgi:hypothetical protein
MILAGDLEIFGRQARFQQFAQSRGAARHMLIEAPLVESTPA